jgi:hypothetical protein
MPGKLPRASGRPARGSISSEKRIMKQGGIVNRVLKGIALAMGVAAVVLSILKAADTVTLIMLLAIGLFSLALASF